jgi:hypothetical protein
MQGVQLWQENKNKNEDRRDGLGILLSHRAIWFLQHATRHFCYTGLMSEKHIQQNILARGPHNTGGVEDSSAWEVFGVSDVVSCLIATMFPHPEIDIDPTARNASPSRYMGVNNRKTHTTERSSTLFAHHRRRRRQLCRRSAQRL